MASSRLQVIHHSEKTQHRRVLWFEDLLVHLPDLVHLYKAHSALTPTKQASRKYPPKSEIALSRSVMSLPKTFLNSVRCTNSNAS